jgi:hypothetical protein
MQQVGTWLSLVERTLGVGEVASSNLVVPTNFSVTSEPGQTRTPAAHSHLMNPSPAVPSSSTAVREASQFAVVEI